MLKEAQFTEGFFQKLVNDFGPEAFSSRPFETIFKAFGWITLWKYSRILGLLSLVGEQFGIGPSFFGKLIDGALGAGKGKLDLSEANLQSAATKASSDITGFLEKEIVSSPADDVLGDIMDIKGYVDVEDAVTAMCVSNFIKTAAPQAKWWRKNPAFSLRRSGRVGFLRDFLSRVVGGGRLGLANVLFGLLRMFAVGILGISAASGIKSFVTGKPSSGKTMPSFVGKPDTGQMTGLGDEDLKPIGTYYANDARDVETTILAWLDKIEGFEKVFKAMRPTDKSITHSVGFQKLLKRIEQMNNANIRDIDKWKAFVGPSPREMVKMVLPGAIYEPIGAAPKGKPTMKPTIKPKEELTKLLSEVL